MLLTLWLLEPGQEQKELAKRQTAEAEAEIVRVEEVVSAGGRDPVDFLVTYRFNAAGRVYEDLMESDGRPGENRWSEVPLNKVCYDPGDPKNHVLVVENRGSAASHMCRVRAVGRVKGGYA